MDVIDNYVLFLTSKGNVGVILPKVPEIKPLLESKKYEIK